MARIVAYGIKSGVPANLAIDNDLVAQSYAPNSQVTSRIIRALTPRSPLGMVMSMYGAFDPKRLGIKTEQATNSKSIYSYSVADNSEAPLRVVDNSRVPDSVKPGETFYATLDEGWVQPPGVFRSKDERVEFLVVERNDSQSDGTSEYGLQLVGNDRSQSVKISRLFERMSPMNYAGNAHGELSATGQHFRTGSKTDYLLTGQVMRHSLPMTGHGMSTEAHPNLMAYWQKLENGKVQWLPLPASRDVLMRHLGYLADAVVNGRGNYDMRNKRVLNQVRGRGARFERPKMSGWLEQFEGSNMPSYPINPLEPNAAANLRATIRTAVAFHRRYWNLPITQEYGIFTRSSGYDFIQDAFKEELAASNQVIQVSPSVTGMVQAGVIVDKLRLSGGTVMPINMDTGVLRGADYDKIWWNGGTHNVRDFNMSIAPLGPIPELEDRPLLRLLPKVWGPVNRGLVCGTINGLTGWGNSLPSNLLSLFEKSEQGIKDVLSQYNLPNSTDGAEFHVLSDVLPVCEMPDLVVNLYNTATPMM